MIKFFKNKISVVVVESEVRRNGVKERDGDEKKERKTSF